MTIPQVNTEQKSSSAIIDHFDDTRSTIGLQSEYNSVISSSHQAAQTMKLAKTIAVTALAMTFVLGIFVLMSTSRVCDCRFGDANLESRSSPFFEPLTASSDDQPSNTKRMPISIQMEGEAGDLMKKNKKGRVNCSVERKVATQIIASEPKLLITPYGNITTDPRIIHMTGEKMIFTCSPGKERGNKKNMKNNKKFATVINLNALEKDEREEKDSTSTAVSNDLPVLRPKRSADKPMETKKKTHLTCDCHCPHDPE